MDKISYPKISVVTPSFNQGKYIKDCIESVLNQDYENIEHIIIDGGSDDSTVEILESYEHLKWISEKDNGPVDAINKGFKMASGSILVWLNSDDYFENNILTRIAAEFNNSECDIVIGNMCCVNETKKKLYRTNYLSFYTPQHLIKIDSDIITQPSTFFSREIFEKVGGFDETLRLVWDYDLFVKMLLLSNPILIDATFSYQRIYDNTLSRGFARSQAIEIFRVARKYGAALTDPIVKKIFKRFLFPSTVKSNASPLVNFVRRIKRYLRVL